MSSDEVTAPAGDGADGTAKTVPFDISKAHQARMYDYVLGGKDNYAADRAAAEQWLKIDPDAAYGARANRSFLHRVIRYLTAEAGIRQFLDIGTGIPTAGNTHQIAQEIAPESRVVYVDYDPVVLAHARALLTSHEAGVTAYLDADLRDTPTILSGAGQRLDFSKPVAITLLAILHAIPDSDDPYGIVARLLDAVPSGSYLAVSQAGADLLDPEKLSGINDLVNRTMQQSITYRTREQVARFFDGTDLVPPGLVRVDEWRQDPGAGELPKTSGWCAVGRKP